MILRKINKHTSPIRNVGSILMCKLCVIKIANLSTKILSAKRGGCVKDLCVTNSYGHTEKGPRFQFVI